VHFSPSGQSWMNGSHSSSVEQRTLSPWTAVGHMSIQPRKLQPPELLSMQPPVSQGSLITVVVGASPVVLVPVLVLVLVLVPLVDVPGAVVPLVDAPESVVPGSVLGPQPIAAAPQDRPETRSMEDFQDVPRAAGRDPERERES
jgi:hypothetical protein